MALSKKPVKPVTHTEGVDVDALINKCGSVPSAKTVPAVPILPVEKLQKKCLKAA
jgi:hypothetical protein